MVTYVSKDAVEVKVAAAAVISCAARELQEPLREFVREGLGLDDGTCFFLLVPGGPQLVVATEPALAVSGERWIRFLVEGGGVPRIVLVGHARCLWYQDAGTPVSRSGPLERCQHDDLRQAAAVLREKLPAATVESWFASYTDDGRLSFQRTG